MTGAIRIVFVNCSTARFFAIALVGSRSHGNVHLLSVAAENDISGAVTACRQIHEFLRCTLGLCIAILVLVSNDAVSTAEVKVAIVKSHAEDAVQSLGVHGSCIGFAIVVCVA